MGTASSGTLNNVTVDSNLDFATNYGAYAFVENGLTLGNGATIDLGNASGTTYGGFYFEGAQTLGGTGTVLFGGNGSNFLDTYNTTYNDPTAGTLTIGSGVTVRGGSGNIGYGYYYAANVVNEGTIEADGAAHPLLSTSEARLPIRAPWRPTTTLRFTSTPV